MKSGEALPSIALVVTGGTIATAGTASLDLATYHETGEKLTAQGLVDRVPEFASVASVHPVEFRRLSSTAITVSDWMELRLVVEALLTTHDGVVIAHGTNTLEETAYFLDLCLSRERPVVVVGAMRPLSALSSDAALNLVRAVQVAGSPDAAGHGVLVVVNEQVFGARDVTKSSSQRTDAFTAPGSGPIGSVDPAGRVLIERRRLRPGPQFDLRPDEDLLRVDIVVSHVGADGALIDAAVAAGARGIVSAGTGAGRPTPQEEDALSRAVDSGVVVCLSSRVPAAQVVPTPGTAAFVAGRGLSPWKARVLLSLALISTSDPDVIQRMFDQA
jgi:L-asparaginase